MKLRLLFLGVIALLLIPVSALAQPTQPTVREVYVPNAVNGYIDPSFTSITTTAGSTFQISYTVGNSSTASEVIDATMSFLNLPTGWTATASPASVTGVAAGESRTIIVTITVPAGTATGLYSLAVRATITSGATTINRTADIQVTIVNPTATATATSTATTATPTGTILPICNGSGGTQNDGFEPDNTMWDANPIEIDITQEHALCPVGDEDWVTFGGLEGKVYTIDIPKSANGLDPSLTLYDSNGNQLAYNDDYYLRNNDPTDVKPRIQSWRAPRNGQYYIKIRDAALRGFIGGQYVVILESESYGPTPTLIAEICEDLYEPDGLPELAPLMVVNEVHDDHRLCPRGDADWVKFFAKKGKTYRISTSNLSVGADTVLVLTDRDGASILDFNDDFGTTLASAVDFSAPVDGFYYAQIKNVGDVGNQFISYTLTFEIVENSNGGGGGGGDDGGGDDGGGDDGGGGGGGGGGTTPTVPAGTTPTVPAGTTTTPVTTTKTPTSGTAYPTPTTTSFKMPNFVTGQAGKFVDPAFAKVWERADAPIAEGAATRSWLWGPKSSAARIEVYKQSSGGLRQVQYFDKSRMEITDYKADRASDWFVTNGLLAKELISGRIQIGNDEYITSKPANVNIAGDLDDTRGPTYASFTKLLGGVANQTGTYVTTTLNRSGKTGAYEGPQREGAKLAHFVPETGHNIPAAFWDFMNRQGAVKVNGQIRQGPVMDWVFALGYPISEPYWARVRVGGVERDVLVQAFERRVLTYTPDNPADWQVEMGNVGQHYEIWRYGSR